MKRYLVFSIIFLMSFIGIIQAETYKLGDVITYNNIKFYVVEDKGDFLTLLKVIPLTAEEINKYGIVNGINYVNKNTYESRGKAYTSDMYGRVAYYTSEKCGYTDSGSNFSECKYDYESSDLKQIIDNWGNDNLDAKDLVKDEIKYREYNNSNNEITKKYTVRLLTQDEFSKYSNRWIDNYSFWLMDDSSKLSCIYCGYSVRPVINLKKDNIEKNIYKSYEIGDVVKINNIKFYVIENSNSKQKSLTLLKETPLTVDEVNKYGIVNGINYVNKNTYESRGTAKYLEGYGGAAYYSSEKCGYTDSGFNFSECKYDYESSDLKQIIDNWGKSVLDIKDNNFDNVYKIVSLTGDNMDIIGYTHWFGTAGAYGYKNQGDVLHFMDKYTNCWSYVSSVSSLKNVCPVVILNKMPINDNQDSDKSKNNDSNISDKSKSVIDIPDTLLKNPIFIVVIGIVLVVIATIVVSLIIKKSKIKQD